MRAAKTTYKILLLILPFIISSCVEVENYFPDYKGETVPVQIKINVNNENDLGDKDIKISRKAPSNINENLVSDIWVIQFNGTTTSSTKVYTKYINVTSSTLGLNLAASSSTNRVVIIANTHNSGFDFSTVTTYQNLLDEMASITNEYDAYGGASNLGLVMSGFADIIVNNVVSSTPINFTLTRSVAKVVLNLNLTATSGLTIDSIVMCDVPNQFNIADTLKALHNTISVPYPVDASTTYNTFAINTNLPTPEGATQTFQWYVPRNMKGTNAGTTVMNKNTNAPLGASYIRIYAKSGTNTVIYRIYPGANMTNDFNIIPNKRYIINIKLNSAGDYTTDARVENSSGVVVDYTSSGYSNSYIINPPSVGQPVNKYRIPVGRVDEYWGSTALGYGGNLSTALLSTSNAWTITLLWQDLSNIVQTSSSTNITLTKTTGLGKNDYFEITVPSTAQFGNFVIKLSRNSAPTVTLWSWHFWVTDYNPYYSGTVVTGAQDVKYTVVGGEVHRYRDNGVTKWGIGGDFQNSYIMDRDIGDLSSAVSPSLNARGVLYYQFGRKDPFPADIPLYNINGTQITYSTSANGFNGSSTMKNSVNNPLVFYYTNGDWCSEAFSSSTTIMWNDVNVLLSSTGKSIFDPSPLGFRLPKTGCWSNFSTTTTTWNSYETIYTALLATYQADGSRRFNNGTIFKLGTEGNQWSASPNGITTANSFYYKRGAVTPASSDTRSSGFVCRPVKQ